MMEAPHPLHEYIAGQIGDQIRNRHLVVIYDRNEELGRAALLGNKLGLRECMFLSEC